MKTTILRCLFLVCAILLVFSTLASAAAVGKITRLEGKVDVLRQGSRSVSGVSLGDTVDVGDIYRSKTNSRAEITFFNKNILRILPATRVQITQYSDDEKQCNQIVKMDRGRVEAMSGQEFIKKVSSFAEGNKFEVHTPNAVAGIRGSRMTVGFAQMVTGLFFSTGHGYFYNPTQPAIIRNVSAGFVSFIVGTGGEPSVPVPGNISHVGGSEWPAPETNMMSRSTGTGLDLPWVSFIYPIDQTNAATGTGVYLPWANFVAPMDQTNLAARSGPYAPWENLTYPTGETSIVRDPPQIPNTMVSSIAQLTVNDPGIGWVSMQDVKIYGPAATGQPTIWAVGSVTPLQITPVMVGAVPSMTGSFGNADLGMTVSLNNVKFYGPSMTGQPTTWQAGSVTGNFRNIDVSGTSLGFNVSGGGMSSYVNVTASNTGLTGTWTGTAANGTAPAGTGSYTQPFSFSGTASGTWSANWTNSGNISGTASGVVPSVLTQNPVITQAIQVGAIPTIESIAAFPFFDYISLQNVKFWGSSTAAKPYAWTAAFVGSRDVASNTTVYSLSSGGLPATTATVNLNPLSGGSFTATVSSGNVPAGGMNTIPSANMLPVGFDGRAAGTYTRGPTVDTLTGTASGKAY